MDYVLNCLSVINYFSILVEDDMKQYGVVSTSGCGLPVKYIIHISSKHNPYKWRKVIKKALHEAEKKALKKMRLPFIDSDLLYRGALYRQ
jgi:hypothetical protein